MSFAEDPRYDSPTEFTLGTSAAVIRAVPLLLVDLVNEDGVTGRARERFRAKLDTGSREENASKQKDRAPFRFNRNGKGSRA